MSHVDEEENHGSLIIEPWSVHSSVSTVLYQEVYELLVIQYYTYYTVLDNTVMAHCFMYKYYAV